MPSALHEMFTLVDVCCAHENENKIELGVKHEQHPSLVMFKCAHCREEKNEVYVYA